MELQKRPRPLKRIAIDDLSIFSARETSDIAFAPVIAGLAVGWHRYLLHKFVATRQPLSLVPLQSDGTAVRIGSDTDLEAAALCSSINDVAHDPRRALVLRTVRIERKPAR